MTQPFDHSVARWRKSTFSGPDNECIEVADGVPGVLPVRDSKDPLGASLLFTPEAWAAFVAGVCAGEFGGE
ncbi:hypothetical protein GCM10009639_10620 [Kitasatospora putterlickiae]|uniref:DUF397 domain-containing protein n=1 Tax=Kitasatospora putterlickiae TaxID=221725 RepID=A0ABN1XUS7_9ACTN